MLSLMLSPAISSEIQSVIAPQISDRLRRGQLVGRSDVLGRLLSHLDGLMAGLGGMVMVSGEPGIGKTRLLDEMIAAGRLRGFQILIGRCHERAVATPYLPISDAIETYASSCTPERWTKLLQAAGPEIIAILSDTVFKHVPMLSVIRPEAGAGLAVKAEARPTRAVRNLLGEIAKETPVLLVVDDLHWADPPSLELLHHLALYTREIPVLILGAYREIELDRTHPLSGLLVDLNRERLLVRARLRRLTLPETSELLTSLLGGQVPAGLAELVHEQTKGNPFFIEEVINGLVEESQLVWNDRDTGYELAPGITVERLADEVPQGIRAAIGARLDHLSPNTQHVLSLASVIGRHFSVELLSSCASSHGLTEDDVDHALVEARAARFVAALEHRRERRTEIEGFTAGAPELEADYAFEHPLIHQVAHAEIDRRRKRRLHAEVGHLMERIYHGREGLYSERLAYHFLESDDDAKALEYCLRAGDKMLRAYYDQDLALGYYLQALEMVLGKDPSLRHLAAAPQFR